MAVALNKRIVKVSATAGVWTYTCTDVDGVVVGARVDIGGFATNQWNVTNETVDAVNTDLLTVTVSHGNATVAQTTTPGQLHIHCHWIDEAFVETQLGYTPEGSDADYLTQCVEAANDWAFLRRAKAGWDDLPTIAPGHNAKLGTAQYAMALYRAKGSVDQFSTFADTPLVGMTGTMGDIKKLLEIDRAGVA